MKQTLLLTGFLFSFLLSFGANSINTQQRKCGSTENLLRLKQLDPGLESRMQQLENFTNSYALNKNNANTTNSAVIIPVVFHIVYNSPSQNISDALCQAQVSQLNLDFAKLNTDASNIPVVWQGIAANTNIQFCMAQRDPNGMATSGIERRSTTVTSFTTDNNVKLYSTGGMDAWPSSSYLNIWVTNISGGIIGYAQFPGGPSASDGVVLHYSTVGSMLQPGSMVNYNHGRTATHEVGHWLNLIHIWGDESGCVGTDNVGDTPNQGAENYGNPVFPLTDGCSTTSPGVMFMNYMDYVNDVSMYMFTAGQSTRMNALFSNGGPRQSLLSSLGGQAPASTPVACGVATGFSSSSITSSSAILSWGTVTGANSYVLKYKKSTASTWSSVTSATNTKTLTNLLSNSIYQCQVQAVCGLGGGGYTTISTFTTLAAPPCGVPSSLTTSMITPGGTTLSWAAVGGAVAYSVQYKINGALTWTNASSATNSKTLSGLTPASDYTFQISATCQSGTSAYSAPSTFTTLPSNCTDNNEPNNTYLTSSVIPVNTDITGQMSITTDVDWFTFTTTAPNTKMLIVLSNLPKDYNMTLYNSSLTQLATATVLGTTNDSIKRNFTTAGTYYLKVFGKSGLFDAVMCYNLRVNTSNINFRLIDEETQPEISNIQPALNLYPNPVKDVLTVNFVSISSQTASVRIFDMVGKVVLDMPMEALEGENKYTLDFTGYHKGIYFVEILQNELKITKKVIRE